METNYDIANKMKILFCQPVFHVNQVAFVRELLDRGHDVEFVVRRREYDIVEKPIDPILLPYSQVFAKISEWVRAPRWMKNILGWPPLKRSKAVVTDFDPDVVVARNYHLYTGIFALLTQRANAQFFLYVQDPKHTDTPSRIKIAIEQTYKTLFNEPLQRYTPVLGEGTERAHTTYLPFVIDPEVLNDMERKPWFTDGTIDIISIGRFDDRKNHRMLIESVAQLRPEYDLSVTFVGEIPDTPDSVYENLRNRIERLDLESVVKFAGKLPNQEVHELLYRSDLFVLPSRNEPAGYSHLEAMAQGLPVICSDTNGTKHYIEQGVNGYVFDSGDKENLTQAIERCCRDKGRMIEMGAASRDIIEQNHLPAPVVDRFEDMIQANQSQQ